jgi:hypothetical protein
MLARMTVATFALLLAPAASFAQPAPPAPTTNPSTQPAEAPVATAPSKITAVTVYQGTALVTREVTVGGGRGLVEVVVSPLPAQTIDGSLYTEGTDGIRVLSTRYRTRAVREDAREDVRAKVSEIEGLQAETRDVQQQVQVIDQNLQMLAKLENFTGATLQQLTEKGMLNGEAVIGLSKFVMESRAEKSAAKVKAEQRLQEIAKQIEFAQRQLAELTATASRTLRDAVIVVDKANAPGGRVRLNYLVGAATWRPQYRLRAGGREQDPVSVEYLAAIEQQSGEDWGQVDVTLSTAQPQLNAAPPELLALDVTITAAGPEVAGAAGSGGGGGGAAGPAIRSEVARDNYVKARQLRAQAQMDLNRNKTESGWAGNNEAAALEQTSELLAADEAQLKRDVGAVAEGPSVTYHLPAKFTVPSRNDQQLVEVTRLELSPEWFYKTVPVVSPHVYRLASLTNRSENVLLPGEATMYIGSDFVGRMNLPLVAIGEQFTVGFGVDPQLQVDRQLVDKSRTVQGGNQVHAYDYRIRVSSFKPNPVRVQVWDRLPHGETEAVGVSLVKAQPTLSDDPTYLRTDRPKNLLRWDLTVEPGQNGERAAAVSYQFRLEYARNVAISNFKATK